MTPVSQSNVSETPESRKRTIKTSDHGKRRSRCIECGGSSLCVHGKRKNLCKECGGRSICDNGNRNTSCKECGRSSICVHGKRKILCKECGGSSICDHGRIKSRCKECVICAHGIQTFKCSESKEKFTRNNRGTKRPMHQLFEGRRHKNQKTAGLALLAGNIHLTDDNDY